MKRIIRLAAILCFTGWVSTANAALFNLTYDGVDDGMISPADIVGTGVFSYDGPVIEGSFLLSDLTNVFYSSTLTGAMGTSSFSGPPFDPADLSLIGISVTAAGGGVFELVFTGNSASTAGSLDIISANGLLTHQPAGIGALVTGPLLFAAFDSTVGLDAFGDYIGVAGGTAPLPGTLALLGLGIAGLGWSRRRGRTR